MSIVKKYRLRPVKKIEAIQWTGKNIKEVIEFVGDGYYKISGSGVLTISTCISKGNRVLHSVPIGTYIASSSECCDVVTFTPDEFEAMYEEDLDQ